MRILIINEYLICGGAEQSCLKMKKLLEEHNNEVYYLTFDNQFSKNIKEVENKRNIINIPSKNNYINKMIFKPILYAKIRKKIKEINPQKIIVNNICSSPITQLKALQGYETYQIIRDYGVVCPKITSMKMNYDICKGYKYEKCLKKCMYHNSKIQILSKLILVKKVNRLRKKIVKKVISPSEKLNEYLLDYGYDSFTVNNPMEKNEQGLVQKKFDRDYKEYVYIGMINENKGIFNFLDIYKEFSEDKNIKLKIVGKCTSRKDEERLNDFIKENDKIEFLGYKNHNDAINEIRKADFIVVPSLWIENYPTTALEGMLYGAVVIGSNRGGIPEIIGENRGFIFDILKKESIKDILDRTYCLTEKEISLIRENAYSYVTKNNSFENYYKNLMKVIS